MHNPKLSENEVQRFEKEVQQKMEELEFSPSAAVWENVAKAVRVEKKRRAPFFWLWFLPALLLAGGTGFYLMTRQGAKTVKGSNKPNGQALNAQPVNDQPGNPQSVNDQSGNDPQTNMQPATTNGPSTNPQRTNSPIAATSAPGDDRPGNDRLKNTRPATTPPPIAAPSAIRQPTGSDQPATILQPNNSRASVQPLTRHGRPANAQPAGPQFANEPIAATSASGNDRLTNTLSAKNKETTSHPAVTGGTTTPTEMAESPVRLHPVNVKVIAAIQAAAPAKSLTLTKTRLSPKRSWEAGFTGGVGLSSINQTLFKSASVIANDSRNYAAPIPVTGNAGQTYVSKIRPDLSFWAGIFVQKPVLNNVAVSVGLNLHYYSTKVSTGDKVVNNASSYYYSPAASLLSLSSTPVPTAAQSYPYYAAGDKQSFINRYYFLEIPGSIQWQISHTRTMPLFWELGGTLSYLMSSNAIYYNTKAGVYYKDGQVSNKAQFNLSTALMVKFPLKGFEMQMGPQVQYGLTSLLNTGGSSGQHFLYGGVKLVIFPGKSHKNGRLSFHGQ